MLSSVIPRGWLYEDVSSSLAGKLVKRKHVYLHFFSNVVDMVQLFWFVA